MTDENNVLEDTSKNVTEKEKKSKKNYHKNDREKNLEGEKKTHRKKTTKVIKEVKNEKIKFKVLSKYKNYNFQISKNDLKNLDFEKEKYVFVINKNLKDMIELIVSKNYVKEDYGIYSILKPEI